jgi:hypothetical protein
MTKHDEFVMQQVTPMLHPGEQVMHTGVLYKAPGLLLQILLLGGLLSWLMTTGYYAVVTSGWRLLLIKTKMSLWMGVTPANRGVEEINLANVKQITTSGFANNRSMTFNFVDGSKRTLRCSPWSKQITGNAAFFEQLPQIVNNRQLPPAA